MHFYSCILSPIQSENISPMEVNQEYVIDDLKDSEKKDSAQLKKKTTAE